MRRLTARILSQGDEIVAGSTQDTNSGWLARRLGERGVEVVGLAAAGDDLGRLVDLVAAASGDVDLVVSSGGLGPTSDDLSAAAAAGAAGVDLHEDAVALAQVRARFARIQRPMAANNAKQALLPRGCCVLENPEGTAPGFALDIGRARAFFFPGVPRELFVMVARHLDPWLERQGLKPPLVRRFHVCGVGESVLEERLAGLALPAGLRLGYKTWAPYNSVLLYGDPSVEGAAAGFDSVTGAIRDRLAGDRFGEDEETLAAAVGRVLAARRLTVAVAESCTAGLALALLTEAAGASAWVRGGVVAYDDQVKRDLLGVPEAVLGDHGAVSEACARTMAEGVRVGAGASIGLAITGIAGPGGGSAEKPVGLVCFALADGRDNLARTVRFGDRGRDVVRGIAAAYAVEWLRRHCS